MDVSRALRSNIFSTTRETTTPATNILPMTLELGMTAFSPLNIAQGDALHAPVQWMYLILAVALPTSYDYSGT